jgi:hypothetical protein
MKPWLSASVVVAVALTATIAHAQQSIRVVVTGEVANPGEVTLEGKPRLADAVKAAQVNRDAYALGAAWLRPLLQPQQTRLKAGLLYDLGVIGKESAMHGHESLADLAQRTRAWISAMPVTGRELTITLEPHALQVNPSDNPPLADGDHLTYPPRPQTVAVVGAVAQMCQLPHVGLKDARDYLADCATSEFADPDVLFVIEPDGRLFEEGIALWNRSPARPVAPGAIVYVPFNRHATAHAADAGFNHDMAEFLATQPLGGTGVKP